VLSLQELILHLRQLVLQGVNLLVLLVLMLVLMFDIICLIAGFGILAILPIQDGNGLGLTLSSIRRLLFGHVISLSFLMATTGSFSLPRPLPGLGDLLGLLQLHLLCLLHRLNLLLQLADLLIQVVVDAQLVLVNALQLLNLLLLASTCRFKRGHFLIEIVHQHRVVFGGLLAHLSVKKSFFQFLELFVLLANVFLFLLSSCCLFLVQ